MMEITQQHLDELKELDTAQLGISYPWDDGAQSYFVVGKNKYGKIIANGIHQGFVGRSYLLMGNGWTDKFRTTDVIEHRITSVSID